MRSLSCRLALAGLLVAAIAGCSRPVAPVSGTVALPATDVADALRGGRGPNEPPYLVRLEFEGPVVTLDRWLRPRVQPRTRFFVYSDGSLPSSGVPQDTLPDGARLVRVHWAASDDDSTASGLDERVGVREVAEALHGRQRRDSALTFTPGLHLLGLDAPARLGGQHVVVAFMVGFAPQAWWAGPDPSRFPRSSDGDGRAVDVTDWAHFTTSPAWPPDGRRYFGPDSFGSVPSQRAPVRGDFGRRTFYEIFGDRIYARSEGDTVHQGAWIVLVSGGYDRDSRYVPMVVAGDPALPPGYASQPWRYPVLVPQGLLGSPIAFRAKMVVRRPDGSTLFPSESSPYPRFDPGSVFREPHVAGYVRATWPGRACVYAVAEDADGIVDRRLQRQGDVLALVDLVDAGGGDAAQRQARRQVITFFVREAATAPVAAGVRTH